MCVLTINLRKLVCVSVALILSALWFIALADDDDERYLGVPRKRNVDNTSRQKTEGEGANTKTDQDEAIQPEDGVDEEDDEGSLPDIRRRPPRTDEEEQRYKRFKFQTDPFLTVWDFSGHNKAYNPMDYLTKPGEMGSSFYIAQIPSGEVVGSLSIDIVSIRDNKHGQMIQITLRKQLESLLVTIVHVEAETLRPIRLEEWDMGINGESRKHVGNSNSIPQLSPPRFLAEYSFDRVDIEREQGEMISSARFRQLPYSFDKTSLVLVARNINFKYPSWPFQAALTDPVVGAKVIMSIPKPAWIDVLSAEPKTYSCYELKLQLGGLEETWWIERVQPNRLIKFTQNGKTFTLSQYMEQK